jgi:hypothetical protein
LDFHQKIPFHHPSLETSGEQDTSGIVSLSDRP